MRSLAVFSLALLLTAVPALAGDPPYAKLARALGTPHLASSIGPKDHAYLQLKFTPDGETEDKFTKMTTISILKVAPTTADTEAATRGVIVRLRDEAKVKKAVIASFDESPIAPVTLFYAFSGDGDTSKGIVYSPEPGYVTAVQIDAKNGGTVLPADVTALKNVIASAK